MKHSRMLVAFVFASVLAAAVAACGGVSRTGDAGLSPGPASSASAFSVARYVNDEFGFSIQYPEGFQTLAVPPDAKDAGAPKLDVLFVDPQGAQVGGKSVDTLEAAVYRMSAAPKDADFATHKKDFEAMLAALVGDLPDFRVAQPLVWTTVDGRPAVKETYTYTIQGKDVATSAQLAFKDDLAYLVRAQASRATWTTTGRQLVSCMARFAFL